jgi:glutamine---fructose-6-phosphate transaminase (isomerizing)
MSATWMRREIGEQPEAIARTVDALVPLGAELRRLAAGARQVLFVARGSSDNAAVYGQYLCSVRAGRLATLASPSVATAYSAELDLRGVLAVGVSQSGRTAKIVETLRWARRRGAATACVTNEASSPLAAQTQVALVIQAGAERALPATKTYSTQLAALAVLGGQRRADRGAGRGRVRADLRRSPRPGHRLRGRAGRSCRGRRRRRPR